MTQKRHSDNPWSFTFENQPPKKIGEVKMTEMIHPHSHLEAIFGLVSGKKAQTCVVYQDVNSCSKLWYFWGELFNWDFIG